MVRTTVFPSVAIVAVLVASSFAVISRAAAQSNYIAIHLGRNLELTGIPAREMTGVGDGQQVGNLYAEATYPAPEAILLTGTSSSLVTLTPSSYPLSMAFDTSVTVDAAKSMNISSLLTVAEDCSLVLDGANITAGTTRLKVGSTLSGQGIVQRSVWHCPG